MTRKRTTGANSGLAKVAVSFSADTFVVNQSSVLRINICGVNRHLRQAAKRTYNGKLKIKCKTKACSQFKKTKE